MSESHSRCSLVIVVLSALYLCALAAPITYPPSFWGINHLQYFDWSKRLLVLAGGIMLSVVLTVVVRRFRVSATVKRLALYGLAPLSLSCLFYFLHVRHHYLGDGILRIGQLDTGYMLMPTEPLGYLANVAVYRFAGPLFHFTGAQAMEALSYISGVITYFAALYFARTLCHSAEQRLTAFVVLMFSGVTLLYCGYAETYTLLPALLMLFFATGMRALQWKLSMLIPGSLFTARAFSFPIPVSNSEYAAAWLFRIPTERSARLRCKHYLIAVVSGCRNRRPFAVRVASHVTRRFLHAIPAGR